MKSIKDEKKGIVPENKAEEDFVFEMQLMYTIAEALHGQMIRIKSDAKRLDFKLDHSLMHGLNTMLHGYKLFWGFLHREPKSFQFSVSGCGDAMVQTFRLMANNSATCEDLYRNYCLLRDNTQDRNGHEVAKYEDEAFDTLLNTTEEDIIENRSWLK